MISITTGNRREFKVIGAVGLVHLFSHFYQLSLAPLFPLIKAELGISNVELGALISLFFIASALMQTPAGFLVDRFGARPVLLGGLTLLSLSVTGYALAPGYPALMVLVVIAGVGNSVFHPADYALMNQVVSPGLMGRAYSIHTIGGHLGYALAPVLMALMALSLGWRGAIAIAGVTGLAVAVCLLLAGWARITSPVRENSDDSALKQGSGISVLLSPAILSFFVFFMILAMGLIGFQNFTPTALINGEGFNLVQANGALAGFLIGAPLGILTGGIIADRYRNHDLISMTSFIGAALIFLWVGFLVPGPTVLIGMFLASGFLFGLALPSRDLVVRAATPPGASGRVFGFVYGGLDTGAAITPVVYGWFLDQGNPDWIFLASGCFILTAGLLMMATSRLLPRSRTG
jgi:MFS family permease